MRNGNGRGRNPDTTAAPTPVRCAIYTRKSTEEGLEQDFNSLDAQREAGEAYVLSQRHEGWTLVPNRYDDGGYSGGNIDRPALQSLMEHVCAGQIDCVVVYKVDRLSRSLLDFAQLIQQFDKHGVSFVSVTQQFNTTTSLGRLTLNILLSFAQFEREIISERTRDKVAAARKKGKWIGGHPILGYDIDTRRRRLVVNPEEAELVKAIFASYLDYRGLLGVVDELNSGGRRTKRWIATRSGTLHGGKPFSRQTVYNLLTNVLYTGRVEYQGTLYDGEHEAIVSRDLWDRVQATLRASAPPVGVIVRNKHAAILKGMLYCVPCRTMMIPTFTARKSKRYRYYVCLTAQKKGWKNCPSKAVAAQAIESTVVQAIRSLAADQELAGRVITQAGQQLAGRIEQLRREASGAERRLRDLNAELTRVAATPGQTTQARAEQSAPIQQLIEDTEGRLTRLRGDLACITSGTLTPERIREMLADFDPVWKALNSRDQIRLLRMLIEKVGYDGRTGKVSVVFRAPAAGKLCGASEESEVTR